jgi:hypothetical protein
MRWRRPRDLHDEARQLSDRAKLVLAAGLLLTAAALFVTSGWAAVAAFLIGACATTVVVIWAGRDRWPALLTLGFLADRQDERWLERTGQPMVRTTAEAERWLAGIRPLTATWVEVAEANLCAGDMATAVALAQAHAGEPGGWDVVMRCRSDRDDLDATTVAALRAIAAATDGDPEARGWAALLVTHSSRGRAGDPFEPMTVFYTTSPAAQAYGQRLRTRLIVDRAVQPVLTFGIVGVLAFVAGAFGDRWGGLA